MAAPTRSKRTRSRSGSRRSPSSSGSRSRSRSNGSRSPSARAGQTDALKMLKEDHARVKELFDRFEKSTGSSKERIARTICDELKVHAQLEEDLFYPAIREAIEDEDLVNEAEVEHGSAKDLIAQIEDSSPSDDRFEALVTVLGEYIKHHVKEEEGEMFPQVKRSKLDTAELGEQMQEHKRELEGRLSQSGGSLSANA
jgi:hemerythrin-like domain-containing protein